MLPNLILQRASPAIDCRVQTQTGCKLRLLTSHCGARPSLRSELILDPDQLNMTARVWCHLMVISVHVRSFPSLLVRMQ